MTRLLPALALALTGCATPSGPSSAPPPAALAPCPGAPHCVSSLAEDEGHRVAPFRLKDPASGWVAVGAAVRATERAYVVQADAHYLHAEVISPWHFYTDDLELMLQEGGRVDVRSSSRIGYYDFKVNRQRVEALRATLAAQGLIAP